MEEENDGEGVDYVAMASAGIARRLAELEGAYAEYCRLMSAQRALHQLSNGAAEPAVRPLGRPLSRVSFTAQVREALGQAGQATRDELCALLEQRGVPNDPTSVANTVSNMRERGELESVRRGVYVLTDAGAAKLEQAEQA